MHFTFKFSNDFGEPANVCVRCQDPNHPTRERCVFAFPGVRIIVWACPSCLAAIANPFWMLHEFLLRSVYKWSDCRDSGEAVAEYQGSFDFSGNGVPLTKNRNKTKQARPRRADRPAGGSYA